MIWTTPSSCGLQTSQTLMAIFRHFALRVFFLVLPAAVHNLCFMLPYSAISKTPTRLNVTTDMPSNVYMNNIISGCQASHQAVIYYKSTRAIMQRAHFNLCPWASNCQELKFLVAAGNVDGSNITVSGMLKVTLCILLWRQPPLNTVLLSRND